MAHVVAAASREAGKYVNQDNQHYTVLLIITDGIITDMVRILAPTDQSVYASPQNRVCFCTTIRTQPSPRLWKRPRYQCQL